MFRRRQQRERDLDRELRNHLELEAEEQQEKGAAPDAARFAAHRAFGNAALVKEDVRAAWGWAFIERTLQDLAYASRVLLKSPAYTLVGILSLALGIGANTAIFSVVHAVLLRPLPYPQPEQLVRVGYSPSNGPDAVTIPQFEFWRDNTPVFSSATGYRGAGERTLAGPSGQEAIRALPVTDSFFRTLGVPLLLGREFTNAETHPGPPRGIVLGYDLWQRDFGAAPDAIGRVVTVDSAPYTVVGVAPRGFWFPEAADAYVPLVITGSLDDNGANTDMIARLTPGTTPAQLAEALKAVAANFRASRRARQEFPGLQAASFHDSVVGDVRLKLLLLFGVAAALLLIACLNLAGLLLARFSARRREIAVRLSLGSGVGRLLAQFLAENGMLAAAGCAAGLLGARWLLRGILAFVPFALPASEPIALDAVALGMAIAIAAFTAVAFSVTPILSARRLVVFEALKSGGRAIDSGARQSGRSVLVVAEVALSVTLLVSAALMIQTLYRMHRESLGFSPEGVLAFNTPAEPYRARAAQQAFNRDLLARLQSMPGVQAAAAANQLPLTGHSNLPTQRMGHPEQSIGGMEVRIVTPDFFNALRMTIARGRALATTDSAAAPPVMLVNETLARRWWGQQNPIGDTVQIGRFQDRDISRGDEPVRQVIGIVADAKTEFLTAPPQPTVYIPADQAPWAGGGKAWVVRADHTAGLGERIRKAVAEIDSRQRIRRMRQMQAIVSATTAESRFDAWLFGAFAGLALVLATIGIYGLLAFSVARRTSEFGIRMALGASRGEVLRLVLAQGAARVAIGLAAGLAGSLVLTKSLASLLYGVKPTDPLSFVAVAAALIVAGLAASYIPARRATRVDPMVALRYE